MTPIFVINLDRCRDRLVHMEASLGALGLGFSRVPAVDGQSLDARVMSALHASDAPRALRPAEVGCFLSHRRAWALIATGTAEFGIVLEDDIHIHTSFAAIAHAPSVPASVDLVKLETYRNPVRLGQRCGSVDVFRLQRLESFHFGSAAYLLRRDAARRALESSITLHVPVDDFLFDCSAARGTRQKPLDAVQIIPAPCIQDVHAVGGPGFESTIQGETPEVRESRRAAQDSPRSTVLRVARELNRAACRIVEVVAHRRPAPIPFAGPQPCRNPPLPEDAAPRAGVPAQAM